MKIRYRFSKEPVSLSFLELNQNCQTIKSSCRELFLKCRLDFRVLLTFCIFLLISFAANFRQRLFFLFALKRVNFDISLLILFKHSYQFRSLLSSERQRIVLFVPLAERNTINNNDRIFHQSFRSNQFIVAGVINNINYTSLSCATLSILNDSSSLEKAICYTF